MFVCVYESVVAEMFEESRQQKVCLYVCMKVLWLKYLRNYQGRKCVCKFLCVFCGWNA